MRPDANRNGTRSQLACEGYREIPVRAVPLEQDSVSGFDPRGLVWVGKAERLKERIRV